ncbi:hypothetical protein FACS189459_0030 [Bacilli bacterium]|nr:hypothetical protein FACS189459_0030 [Bacilli bacterium]GHU51983.1 hypothetical protein FACS189496_1310 [Bacilli bacterium]
MKLVNFNFKMPADIKKQFEDFSDKVGLTMSGIFNAFVRKTLSDNKLPFEISATSDLQK